MSNTTHPPAGPTEQDVREHFAGQIPDDAQLMRPAYTSIWALEDGTLLWDWRNGYAVIGSANHIKAAESSGEIAKLKCIIYLSGSDPDARGHFVSFLRNALELKLEDYKSLRSLMCAIDHQASYETIVVSDRAANITIALAEQLKSQSEHRGLIFKHLKI